VVVSTNVDEYDTSEPTSSITTPKSQDRAKDGNPITIKPKSYLQLQKELYKSERELIDDLPYLRTKQQGLHLSAVVQNLLESNFFTIGTTFSAGMSKRLSIPIS
jgi:hypothetical protein